MSGLVYVVHCIDTEGPLYEIPTVLFEEIEKNCGIQIEPTEENLSKLRAREMDFGDATDVVYKLVENHSVKMCGTWDEVDRMVDKVTSLEYRNILKDSFGQGWKFSWFCMDHVGFTGKNPRHRAYGYHVVFDKYMKRVSSQNLGDTVQFHHHPVSLSGNYNDCGFAFWGRDTLDQILTRRIIDRQWFPVAFRPGFHTERPDSHWFLEQWIPYDYGNQSMHSNENEDRQRNSAGGHGGDWRHAPLEWQPYHPSYRDYQEKGDCKRLITRCLNMHARIREITMDDIREAFEMAANGKDTILAFTDHDYKDMEFEITRVRDMLKQVSNEYADVKFKYANAVDAMREWQGLMPKKMGLECHIEYGDMPILVIKTEEEPFNVQPYLAIKTRGGKYIWDNLDFYDKKEWHYIFNNDSVYLDDVEKIGVAINNITGVSEVWNWEH